MSGPITLASFVGEHELGGVDMSGSGDANGITFSIDGRAYQALEDENDGYRSALGELREVETPLKNHFDPVRVVGTLNYDAEILRFIDVKTGKVVLEVGTDNADDYYPSFVANFTPEHLAHNQPES